MNLIAEPNLADRKSRSVGGCPWVEATVNKLMPPLGG